MRLEKAHGNSGESGMVGWISSNDVTLFTMILVVMIALMFYSDLIKGKEQLSDLSEEHQETSAELDDTITSLTATEEQRAEFERLTQQLRNELSLTKANLETTSSENASNIRSLADLHQEMVAAKAELNKRIQDLQAAFDSLDRQKKAGDEKASVEIASLKEERDSLTTRKRTLDESIADLSAQLAKARDDAEKERDRLNRDADNLNALVADLTAKLGLKEADLAKLRDDAKSQQVTSTEQIAALQASTAAASKKAADALAKFNKALDYIRQYQAYSNGLKQKVTGLEGQLSDTQKRLVEVETLKRSIRRELVGLKGPLRKVAVLFDSSGSMNQDQRWVEAQRIATTWLDHLDVDQCVLIVFASRVQTFPADGSMVAVRGPDGRRNREQLMSQLKSVKPEGWTNTLEALRTAYRYDVDTIVLLSDGAPTHPNSGKFDPRVADAIYSLCRQNRDVPVNTIGLGNYFDRELSTFLRTVANVTGGTFLGR